MKLLSELLHSEVRDADGRALGNVTDVRLVQDGPILEGFGAALRVDGLVVGTGSFAVRLGYHRHGVTGPALLKAIFGTLERRARFVPWDQVAHWEGSTVQLRVPGSDVPTLPEAY
jgi:hypothetical protein